jgi:hypothetical protein
MNAAFISGPNRPPGKIIRRFRCRGGPFRCLKTRLRRVMFLDRNFNHEGGEMGTTDHGPLTTDY